MAVEVSVIVPVCNVERYVGECLEGLHAQTLQELEILLVDDGSTDDCPRILAQAAARDGRMRVITKPNGGYGSAVNAGLAQARGRYVGIVEPDDVVDGRMFAELLAAARLPEGGWADVVKSSYWNLYDYPGREPFLEAPNLMKCMPKRGFCATVEQQPEVLLHHPSVWSCLYRRAFLEKHGIRMMEVPGGGWVDNPFFFETLLQAERFVWTPAAYYYYRQTNPNSSSNLKDFRLPYDRLRDLRALFKRLNVTNPQVIAYLYARHFFYTASVVGEWGYSERDPQLAALIREALEALDPDILYGGYRGINPGYLAYYDSVVGDPVKGVAAREAAAVPRVSVVVPARNDREDILPTLRDLAAQTVEDLEVVCVDCGSEDATPELIAAFAAKDQRFTLVRIAGADRAAGMAAGLAQVHAPACAVVMPGWSLPQRHFEQALAALDAGADLAIAVKAGERCFSPLRTAAGGGVFPVKGQAAELLLCAAEGITGCTFTAACAACAGRQARPGDDEGLEFLLAAVCAADTVQLSQGPAPTRRASRHAFTKVPERTGAAAARRRLAFFGELSQVAAGLGEDAERAARCLVVRLLLDDARRSLSDEDGEEIFGELCRAFWEDFGLARAPRGSYCDQDAFLDLERLMSASYTSALVCEAAREARALDAASRELDEARRSSSYRIGNTVVRTARRLLPKNIVRSLRSR